MKYFMVGLLFLYNQLWSMGQHNQLYCAARNGEVDKIQSLIDQGADVNGTGDEIPLIIAINYAALTKDEGAKASADIYAQIVSILLKNNANPNIKLGGGRRPLHTVMVIKRRFTKGHLSIAQDLIKYHANPNIIDQCHWTPFRMAAYEGYVEIIQFFLNNGAQHECIARAFSESQCFAHYEQYKTKEYEDMRKLLRNHIDTSIKHMEKFLSSGTKQDISKNYGPFPKDIAQSIARLRYQDIDYSDGFYSKN